MQVAVVVQNLAMRDVGFALVVAGLTSGVGALVVLQLVPSGLSPLRNAVSQYGISPYRLGYRVQTLGYALAGFGAAAGISALRGHNTLAVAMCALFGVSRAVISWFPMDEPGSPRTITGRRHGLLALLAFGSALIAAIRLPSVISKAVGSSTFTSADYVVTLLMVVSFFLMGATRRSGSGYFGLAERGFYVCMTAWLLIVGILIAS